MRQLDTELRRFFSRRIVWGAVLLATAIVLLAIVITTAKGHPASTGNPLARTPATVFGPNGPTQGFVYGGNGPRPDTRIDVGRTLGSALQGSGVAFMLLAFVLGASFVGAEFNVGSLTTQLLYEPRRWRVHLAKAAAVAIGCAALVFALCLLIGVCMYIASELHGIVRGIDGAWLRVRVGDGFRIAGVAAVASAMTYAVTLVARRSSAAITLFFLQFPFISGVSVHNRVFGWLSRIAPLRGLLAMLLAPYHHDVRAEEAVRTRGAGVVLAGIWLIALLVGCGLSFSRSEVR